MHSFETKKHTFHHNGGYDGEVIIQGKSYSDEEFRIDFSELLQFVAEYIWEFISKDNIF